MRYKIGFLLLLTGWSLQAEVCNCLDVKPMTFIGTADIEVIFYGRVINVDSDCSEESTLEFEIIEQYKGELDRKQEITYQCGTDCGMSFIPGEEWVIYGIRNNAQDILVELCSRSRRRVNEIQVDFYKGYLGATFEEELSFLRETFEVNKAFEGGLKNRQYEKVDPSLIPWFLGASLLFVLLGMGVMKLLDKQKGKPKQ